MKVKVLILFQLLFCTTSLCAKELLHELAVLHGRYENMEFSMDNSTSKTLATDMNAFLKNTKEVPNKLKPAMDALKQRYNKLRKINYIQEKFKKCFSAKVSYWKKVGLDNLESVALNRLQALLSNISASSELEDCNDWDTSFKKISEFEKDLKNHTRIFQFEDIESKLHDESILQLARNLADFRRRYKNFPNRNIDPVRFLCIQKKSKRHVNFCSKNLEKEIRKAYYSQWNKYRKDFKPFSNQQVVDLVNERRNEINLKIRRLKNINKKFELKRTSEDELQYAYDNYATEFASQTNDGTGLLFRTEVFEKEVGEFVDYKKKGMRLKELKSSNAAIIKKAFLQGSYYLQQRAKQLFDAKEQARIDKLGYQGSDSQRAANYAKRLHPDVYLRKRAKSVYQTLNDTPGIAAQLLIKQPAYAEAICDMLLDSIHQQRSDKNLDKMVFWGQVVGGVVFVPSAVVGVGSWVFRGSTAYRALALGKMASIGRAAAALDGVLGVYSAQKAYDTYIHSHEVRAYLASGSGDASTQQQLRELSHQLVDESLGAVLSLGGGALQSLIALKTVSFASIGKQGVSANQKLRSLQKLRSGLRKTSEFLRRQPKLKNILQKIDVTGEMTAKFIHTMAGLPEKMRQKFLTRLAGKLQNLDVNKAGWFQSKFSNFVNEAFEALKKC